MESEWVRNKVDELLALYEKKSGEYKSEPINEMTVEDFTAMIKVKILRVREHKEIQDKIDDLEDMIVYAFALLEKLEEEVME